MTKIVTALHFEFSQFHKRISQPLTEESVSSDEGALLEYALGVVERIEAAKRENNETSQQEEFAVLCRSGLLLELIQITMVEQPEFASCRLPRWLLRHCGFLEIEPLVLQAESAMEDEKTFWNAIKVLAVMDLTPVVSNLLARYLEESSSSVSSRNHHYSSVELLLAFFEEVPSLFDIGASARSVEEGVHAIEKRRQMASVAFFRDKNVNSTHGMSEALKTINFIWRLIINAEDDYDFLLNELLSISKDQEWCGKAALVWTWLHTLDPPSVDLMTNIGQEIAPAIGADSMNASVMDALIYAGMAGDVLSLLTLLIPEQEGFGGKPFLAVLIDIVFYAGGLPPELGPKIRDTVLMEFCHWLSSSGSVPVGLGLRLAADVVGTLTAEASARGQEEIIGKLARRGYREWFTALNLIGSGPGSLAESVSLETFHSHLENGEIVNAIHALAVAAEVGADVHIGACRISDFVDQHGAEVMEALREYCMVKKKCIILPEYIQSGRFEFYTEYISARKEKKCDALVRLAVSPNCPPELLVPLITEIKQMCCSSSRMTTDECIALCKVLIDSAHLLPASSKPATDTLLSWLSTEAITMVRF